MSSVIDFEGVVFEVEEVPPVATDEDPVLFVEELIEIGEDFPTVLKY